MPEELPARQGMIPLPDSESIQLRNDLRAALDKVVPEGDPMDTWLGPLAALLIARWAGYDESEREAVAAANGQPFAPELPEALRLPAWDAPVSDQADAIAESLRGMTALDGEATNVGRYVASVVPLIVRSVENSQSMFRELLAWVRRLEVGTPQGRALAARLFDDVLFEAVEKQGKLLGEFVTPKSVAALMLELADPQPGERIYDPCFGFGEFLVGVARRLRSQARTAFPDDGTQALSSGIFGSEIHPVSYVVGLCRVLLTSTERPVLELGDTLERPLPSKGSREGFDCILAAPPWGRRPSSHSPLRFQSRNVEILFLQHVMDNLRPGGRAVVVYPYEALADPDWPGHYPAGNQVRKALLQNFRLDAVVSPPPDVFMPVTGIEPGDAKIVLFQRFAPRSTVPSVKISSNAWRSIPEVMSEDDGCESRGFECASVTASRVPVNLLKTVAEWVRCDSDRTALELPTGVTVSERPVRDLLLDDPLIPAMMAPEYSPGDFGLADPDERVAVNSLLGSEDFGSEEPSLRFGPLEEVAEVYTPGSDGHRRTTGNGLAPDTGTDGLRVGDIVVSMAGDVGKIDLVSATRGIGSNADRHMAVLRAREGVKPEYLAAILRSPNYRIQMESHARKRTVQQLSLRNLRELRIPVPGMSVQEMVLAEIESAPKYKATAELNKLLDYCGHDAVGILFRVLSGAVKHLPLAVWTESPIVAALALERDDGILDPWNGLIGCSRLLADLAPKLHGGRYYDSDSQVWFGLDKAIEAADGLVRCARVPMGAGRLAVIERARGMLHWAMEKLVVAVFRGDGIDETEDVTPYDRRLWWFLFVMAGFADREIQMMRESIRLDIAADPTEVPVDADSEIRLHLSNSSFVPLLDLHVSTQPPVGQQDIPYLADGAHVEVPLTVHPEGSTQPFQIIVSWRARHLDGMDVKGEEEIGLSVSSVRKPVPIGDLGTSPYIVGNPVDREDMFYGRTRIMERIKAQLGPEANVILLEGNRRTGKTSILRQLGKADVLPGWIPVYCSFQDADSDDKSGGIATHNVFRLLAREIAWTLYDAGVETWLPGLPDRSPARPFRLAFGSALNQAFAGEHPFEALEFYIESALQAARPKRVLLMLDEFDKLQEGIDAGVTSPQVPENIRHLLQHQPGLSAIITGSRRLKRLREEYWSALFGFGHRIGVSALPARDARQLVTEPVDGRLDYLPQARDRIVSLCARHPFLIQSLCNRVFEQAVSRNTRTITLDVVKRAATEMVDDNEHFRTLWDYAGSTRRRIILAFCDRLAEGPDPVNLNLLGVKLEKERVPFLQLRDIGDDIKSLRELELLDLDERHRRRAYRLAIPLMAKWLRRNVDFDDLLERARQEVVGTQR